MFVVGVCFVRVIFEFLGFGAVLIYRRCSVVVVERMRVLFVTFLFFSFVFKIEYFLDLEVMVVILRV